MNNGMYLQASWLGLGLPDTHLSRPRKEGVLVGRGDGAQRSDEVMVAGGERRRHCSDEWFSRKAAAVKAANRPPRSDSSFPNLLSTTRS